MREQPQTRRPGVDNRRLGSLMAALSLEALTCIPPAKIAETVRHWLGQGTGPRDDREEAKRLLDAVGLASDLALFAPSASGTTAIERLVRRRKPANRAEAAAMEALRAARLRLTRIEKRESRFTVRFQDLVSGETLTIADELIPTGAMGSSVLARTVLLADGTYALVGPITPLDAAAYAVAMGFVCAGAKWLNNPQRCAEAVYRHVVRHGAPDIPGLNRSPDNGHDDEGLPFGADDSEVDAIAHHWAELGADAAPSAEVVQRVRDFTSVDTVLDVLASSVLSRHGRLDRLADAYASIAAIQIETVRLREANGMSGLSMAMLSNAIAHAIAKHGMPASVRVLFEDLQRRRRPISSGGAQDADLERLIQRIQALRAKTVAQGCTEQEALAAAEKVAELLDRYGLSLSTIELHQQACQGVGIDTGRRRLGPIDDCVPAIAAFFDCRAWSEKSATAPIRHVFFGLRADVEAAHYLYDLIGLAFATETAAFTRGTLYAELVAGERRSATNSFQIGLARGIAAKLHSLRQAREATFRSSGRELVPIKTSVIDDELAKLGLHFRARSRASKRYIMTDAYEAGQSAGERFEFRPGLAAAD
jgi:hypothetical protein